LKIERPKKLHKIDQLLFHQKNQKNQLSVAFYGTLESIRDLAGKLIFRFRHSYVILEK
jgi:hypothetical protein